MPVRSTWLCLQMVPSSPCWQNLLLRSIACLSIGLLTGQAETTEMGPDDDASALPLPPGGWPGRKRGRGIFGVPHVSVLHVGLGFARLVVYRLSSLRDRWAPIRALLSHKKESCSTSTRRDSAPVPGSPDCFSFTEEEESCAAHNPHQTTHTAGNS